MGKELLSDDKLDLIEKHHTLDSECCSEMLSLWFSIPSSTDWKQLIEALKRVELSTVAHDIEDFLKPFEKLQQPTDNQLEMKPCNIGMYMDNYGKVN